MGSIPVSLYLFLAVCVAQLKCCIWRFPLPEIQNKKNVLKHTMPPVLHVNFHQGFIEKINNVVITLISQYLSGCFFKVGQTCSLRDVLVNSCDSLFHYYSCISNWIGIEGGKIANPAPSLKGKNYVNMLQSIATIIPLYSYLFSCCRFFQCTIPSMSLLNSV